MAKADLEVSVTIEQALHAELREWLETVERGHHICIESVSADWVLGGSIVEPRSWIKSIRLVTRVQNQEPLE